MVDRDPIDGLRDAWRGVAPRPNDGALDAADAQTRAVVSALRDAYRAARPRRAAPRVRRPAVIRRVAAAAALAAAAAVAFWPRSMPLPVVPAAPGQDLADAYEPRIVRTTDDRVEIKSGRVRLTLLTPQSIHRLNPEKR